MSNGQSLILAEDKETLTTLGHSIKTLLPGAQALSDNQAISVANYAALAQANPFRGEVYGFVDFRGNLKLVEGYKLLVRWAKKISEYDENYSERLPIGVEGIEEGDVGYRLEIVRHDKNEKIKEYVQMGATFKEAYELVSNSAVGIVKHKETWSSKNNKPIDPPTGWSWDQVARKRALKNVLNQAYAMPSIEELAKDSWQVDGQETIAEDWAAPETYKTTQEALTHARLAAQERERQDKVASMDEQELIEHRAKIKQGTDLIYSNGDDNPLDLAEPAAPEKEFWAYALATGVDRSVIGQFIEAANGDFDKALVELKASQ